MRKIKYNCMTGDEIKRILVHHKVIPVTAMLRNE